MKPLIYTCTIPSPVGMLTLAATETAIIRLDLDTHSDPAPPATPLLRDACRQIEEYFNGVRRDFDVPIDLHGTDFQRSVWCALRTIPYGATASYRDVAVMVRNPLAARAVGNANNKNPVALIVPCHRVINADGSLGGYGGGEHIKQYLLDFEASNL